MQPILCGALTGDAFEHRVKIGYAVEPAGLGNLQHTGGGGLELPRRIRDAQLDNVFLGADTVAFAKHPAKIRLVHMQHIRQRCQRQRFAVMLGNIGHYAIHIRVVRSGGGAADQIIVAQ